MDVDIDEFVRNGFAVLRSAFSRETAIACQNIVWDVLKDHGVDRADRTTWTKPSIPIPTPDQEPFRAAAASPGLRAAYDQLIGEGRWNPRPEVGGTMPIRFPAEEFPDGIGWHIEGNHWKDGDYWTDVTSRGRGLLTLFLFTDVGPADAPTRLVLGSHRYAASALAEFGRAGLPGGEVVDQLRPSTLCRMTAEATGSAGDVYLCHPFVVHTATWPHRGTEPRMMAQPGVEVPDGFVLDGSDPSPVAQAIVHGLADPSGLRPTRRRP